MYEHMQQDELRIKKNMISCGFWVMPKVKVFVHAVDTDTMATTL